MEIGKNVEKRVVNLKKWAKKGGKLLGGLQNRGDFAGENATSRLPSPQGAGNPPPGTSSPSPLSTGGQKARGGQKDHFKGREGRSVRLHPFSFPLCPLWLPEVWGSGSAGFGRHGKGGASPLRWYLNAFNNCLFCA